MPPAYIMFNPGNAQHNQYGDQQVWEQNYQNKYLWYSIAEPDPALHTNPNLDMSRMVENRAVLKKDYWNLVDPNWNQNLKSGSVPPGTQSRDRYNGDNSGTTTLTATKYKDKNYEWRYLGYGESGVAIPNPFFPADYPAETANQWNPETLNWIDKPWGKGFLEPSLYDFDDQLSLDQKKKWFAVYFFSNNPEFRNPSKTLDADAGYWASHFSLSNNPDYSTGIVTGWHTTAGGGSYYASFTFKSPARPNMRITEFKVTEKDTGKIVGLMTGDSASNNKQTWSTNNQAVVKGKTYVVQAVVKNMNVTGLTNHPTTYTPIRMQQMMAIDADTNVGKWTVAPNENIIPSINLDPATIIHSIPYGGSVTFDNAKNDATGVSSEWTFTVPNDVKKEFVYAAQISPGFFIANDNSYNDDDIGRLSFKVQARNVQIYLSDARINIQQVIILASYQRY
jgi:hypothetical protein